MAVVFTKRYVDRSTPLGFRFQFYCDRSANLSIDLKEPTLIKNTSYCSYSFLSTFQSNAAGTVAKMVRAANILIQSAKKDNLAAANEALNMVTKDKYWEEAFEQAVEEAKPNFRQCPKCKRWVCTQNCWEEELQQCEGCLIGSPTNEITLSKAHSFISKVWENVQTVVDNSISERRSNTCSQCKSALTGGKFCGICGACVEKQNDKPATPLVFCGKCGEPLDSTQGLKFCPNCGDSLDYLP